MASRASVVWLTLVLLAAAAAAWLLFLGESGDGAPSRRGGGASGSASAPSDVATAGPVEAQTAAGDADRASAGGAAVPSLDAALLVDTERVRGRLVVASTGAPPRGAVVGARTGKQELDYAALVRAVGGLEAWRRLSREGGLELVVRELGGWKPTYRAEARADGTFELPVPRAPGSFALEVRAEDAAYEAPEWFELGSPRVAAGLTILLGDAGSIEGRLVGDDGAAVSGGRVAFDETLDYRIDRPWMQITRETACDASGRFRILGARPGGVTIYADAPGRGSAAAPVAIVAGKTATLEIALPAEATAEGLVVDESGRGVGGVFVRLTTKVHLGRGYGVARSGADGRVRWKSLVAGEHTPRIQRDGAIVREAIKPVAIPLPLEAPPLQWTLEKGASIAGRVVDGQGKGVANARVTVSTAPSADGKPVPGRRASTQTTASGADGAFRAAGLGDGPYVVRAVLEDVASGEKTGVAAGAEDVEIALAPPTGIAGTVIDAATGKPVASFATVLLTQSERERFYFDAGTERGRRGHSSAAGSFERLGIAPGTYTLRVVADGYADADVEDVVLKAGEVTRGVAVKLPPGARLRGRVVRATDGSPIGGVSVEHVRIDDPESKNRMMGADARTSADGRYEIRGVKVGRAMVVAFHDALLEAQTDVVETHAGETIDLPDVALAAGGSLEGQAIGPDGKPFAGGSVNAGPDFRGERPRRELRHAWRYTTLDREGRFRFDGCVPGPWRVTAQPYAKGDWNAAQRREIKGSAEVVVGAVAAVSFEPPATGGCTVRGKLTRGGQPVGWSSVWINVHKPIDPEIAQDKRHFNATTTEQGEFVFEHVPGGEALITFSEWSGSGQASRQVSRGVTVPADGETRVDVALAEGGEIRGRVTRRSDGTAVAGMSVRADAYGGAGGGSTSSGATTDADGRYVLRGLAPGECHVYVESERWGAGRSRSTLKLAGQRKGPIKVEEGAPATVDFKLEDGATAIVEVLDPDGRPLPNVYVNVQASPGGTDGLPSYAETDDRGIARIDGAPVGTCAASVYVEGYPPSSSEPFTTSAGAETRARVQLVRGVTLVVSARGPAGEVVRVESATLHDASGTIVGWGYRRDEDKASDASVRIHTRSCAGKLTVNADGYEPANQEVTVGAEGGKAEVTLKKSP